jgi:hypothetical protein
MYDLLFEECRKAGIKFIWGFTPAKKAFERIGFEIPFQAHQALMVFDPVKAYSHLSKLNPNNKLMDKLKIFGLNLMAMASSFRHIFSSENNFVVKQILFESKEDLIRKSNSDSSLYYLKMDEKYVAWRITNNPYDNQYENYQFFDSDKLLADVIINFREGGLSYLESIIFGSGLSIDTKKRIVSHLIGIMREKSAFIRLLCFDINNELRSQEDIFRQCGIIVLKRGGHFVWKSLTDTKLDANNLFLTRLFTQGNQ